MLVGEFNVTAGTLKNPVVTVYKYASGYSKFVVVPNIDDVREEPICCADDGSLLVSSVSVQEMEWLDITGSLAQLDETKLQADVSANIVSLASVSVDYQYDVNS